MSKKLADLLKEVANWDWEQFVKAEKDLNYTSNEAIIFALVRATAMQKMDAIRTSLHRLDGKLKTPIIIETPKVYYLYPNAKSVEAGHTEKDFKIDETTPVNRTENVTEKFSVSPIVGEVLALAEEPVPTEDDLPTMSLRETLTKMADYPRELPQSIIDRAQQVEQAIRNHTPIPEELSPRVKSVMAASLLVMAQSRQIDALNEVFDQIDGKLAETLVLGEDMYITMYSLVAPAGATLNSDGILMIQAEESEQIWSNKLAEK